MGIAISRLTSTGRSSVRFRMRGGNWPMDAPMRRTLCCRLGNTRLRLPCHVAKGQTRPTSAAITFRLQANRRLMVKTALLHTVSRLCSCGPAGGTWRTHRRTFACPTSFPHRTDWTPSWLALRSALGRSCRPRVPHTVSARHFRTWKKNPLG